ncbi:MAG: ABC transporter ATP-binding protein [Polyangiaceae bacterium]
MTTSSSSASCATISIQSLPPPAIRLRNVGKQFERGAEVIRILDHIDLDIERGSFHALMGPSGSGKSTLLNLVAGLDRPSEGVVEVAGSRLDSMNDEQLSAWRSRSVGIVFQTYNLMPVLTARENVELPLLLTSLRAAERRKRAEIALRLVGLASRMDHLPNQLSGGQEQRVAIARAIVHDPEIIVADEPTGDLDRQSADDILTLFESLHRELGKTLVMVTHDPAAAARASVIHRLDKGNLS